ncbi:hypothetical protein RF55_14884 [Lasius niger]|uniref:DUF7041 domain-containing protein n=1 Tax=Lasius niger TaxID=67767 RepID=A0A0J7K6V3_LASNI|nr:hypothetical protein RF55_14884 [Lasius niger]
MPREDASVIVEETEDSPRGNRITLRIPPFWPEEPELWFAQLESQLSLAGVTDDDAKYTYTLSRLEPKQAREIKDVITQPPSKNKYDMLKRELIRRLTDSQEQRIRQLLEREELGDRKPSQFLRHLGTLAGSTVSSDLLRTLWLGRLPPHMQTILATRTRNKLSDVAEQADRIHEINNNNRALVLATSIQPTPSTSQSTWEQQIEALTKQVAALTTQITKMTKQSNKERGRRRERSHSRNRARSQTPKQDGVCFYHRRFEEEAKKCTHPCTFKTKNEEGSR